MSGTSDQDNDDQRAKARTDWAEDRTIMANERTFSSWMGTGLGCIGVAIGLQAVFGAFDPTWAAKAVASLFLAAAIAVFWMARAKACKTFARLQERNVEATSTRNFTALAAALTLCAVATGAVLWML